MYRFIVEACVDRFNRIELKIRLPFVEREISKMLKESTMPRDKGVPMFLSFDEGSFMINVM